MDRSWIELRTHWRDLGGLFTARELLPCGGRVGSGASGCAGAARLLRSGGGGDSGSTGEPAGPERDVAARVGRGRTRHAHISLPPLRILFVHVGIIVQHIPRRIVLESVHRGDHRALGDPVGRTLPRRRLPVRLGSVAYNVVVNG